MHQLRVSKYDPSKRSPSGAYLDKDEWCSVLDVGSKVDVATYLDVESDYVLAIKHFLQSGNVNTLRIAELEDNRAFQEKSIFQEFGSDYYDVALKAGMRISIEHIEPLIRLALRELVWFKLVGDSGEYVHSGYELYIYVGVEIFDDKPLPNKLGSIYIEKFASPYLE